MGWFENTPASARLALSVGGATVAALAQSFPPAFQLLALGAGIALCCYGIGASMGTLLKSSDEGWLEEERKKDFERQQELLLHKFRHVKRTI
jgi:hypothetical protein